MKKIYMQPTTEVVRIETQSLLNIVSNGDGTLSGGNQGDLGDGDEVLSRGGFFDDSDDEW